MDVRKKWTLAITGSVLVLLLAGCGDNVSVLTGETKSNQIAVEGIGEIKAEPNVAYVSVNVESKDELSGVAKKTETETSKKVIESLKALGMKEKEVETTNYQVEKYRDYIGGDAFIDLYRATHQIKVTVNDITKITSVLDALAGKENVQISAVIYDVKEKEHLIQEAMAIATKNAEERAKAIATAAKASIKSMNTIQVVSDVNQYPVMEIGYASKSMDSAESTPITPQTQTIKITVQASFNIK